MNYPLDTRWWTDKAVTRLDADAKLLAVYAQAGPQTNRIGFFVCDLIRAAVHLGLPEEGIGDRFAQVCRGLFWKFDATPQVLLIPDWWQAHRPGSPKTLAGFADDFLALPPNALVSEFARVSRQLLGLRWAAFATACGIQVHAPPGEVQEFFPLDAHGQLRAYFMAAWSTAHDGARYCFTHGKDNAAIKRMLDLLGGDLGKAKAVVDMYFEDADEWHRERGSTLLILSSASRLNQYIAALAGGGKSDFDKEWEQIVEKQT